tara:strand:+ start:1655 stop:2083 length:429 start_codon:yes stop_codon:yes gene_type:complete
MIDIKKFKFDNKNLREKAFKIRHTVFVIGQNCPEDIEYENEEICTHFLLTYNREPIGTARYRKTNIGYKLERFAVLKEQRGKGFGHKILKAMLEDLSNYQGVIYMHAQVDVLPFYEKIGFKKEGKIFEEAGIMHYKMQFIRD